MISSDDDFLGHLVRFKAPRGKAELKGRVVNVQEAGEIYGPITDFEDMTKIYTIRVAEVVEQHEDKFYPPEVYKVRKKFIQEIV